MAHLPRAIGQHGRPLLLLGYSQPQRSQRGFLSPPDASDIMSESLKWSTQLHLATGSRKRLNGDKITLPQSALEALLAAAPVTTVEKQDHHRHTSSFDPFNPYSFTAEQQARNVFADRQQQLPHPLTFRLVNPQNGRVVYAGIREFSAQEGTVELSSFLLQALAVDQVADSKQTSRSGTPVIDTTTEDNVQPNGPALTIHAQTLPKGTYVRLRPLEAGYDAEDWKSLLERYLRDNFTTLTNGEVLDVPGARHEHFRFLVDKFEPAGDAICIVDTDLEVDIEALNEEQAKETLNRRLAKARKVGPNGTGSSSGGLIAVNENKMGQVIPGEYVDYELKAWDRSADLEIMATVDGDTEVDVLVSPFSARQRRRPRLDEHVFADFSCRLAKRVKLSHRNVDIEEADSLYVSVHAGEQAEESTSGAVHFVLTITSLTVAEPRKSEGAIEQPGPDEVRCQNCQQIVPKRTLPLHEAFCYRNNVQCPKCKNVFLKTSESLETHWHCSYDEEYGNGERSHTKHNSIFHPVQILACPACEEKAFDIPTLAQHRTTICPEKEILCQFCHLIVPQQGPEDPAFTDAEVLLSGLTPHEVTDGSRTTECHLCGKIVKLQSMKTHMKLHDRDRVLRPRPQLCTNSICGRLIKGGREVQSFKEQLGLCDECFGPLHGTGFDPEGKALRRRVERRLLQQLMGGCGKAWCHNAEWCRTGRRNSTGEDVVVTAKEALPSVKPVLDQLIAGKCSSLRFCTDEASQARKAMAEMLAAENIYELEWCAKALEESKNDLGKARDWLKDMAPRKDEIVN